MMKKTLLLILFAVTALFAITACGNNQSAQPAAGSGETTAASNRVITHTILLAAGSEIQATIEVDSNNRLIYYTLENVFKTSSQEMYDEACDEYGEIVEEENQEGYDFRTTELKTDDKNLTVTIIRKWDVQKNTEGIDIEDTMSYIKDDGTFDIEGWEAQFDSVSEDN